MLVSRIMTRRKLWSKYFASYKSGVEVRLEGKHMTRTQGHTYSYIAIYFSYVYTDCAQPKNTFQEDDGSLPSSHSRLIRTCTAPTAASDLSVHSQRHGIFNDHRRLLVAPPLFDIVPFSSCMRCVEIRNVNHPTSV